jgi:hypothetical protein
MILHNVALSADGLKFTSKNILPYCRPSGTFVLAAEQLYYGSQSVIVQI